MCFVDEKNRLREALQMGHQLRPYANDFFRILSVCHTVIPEVSADEPDVIRYQVSRMFPNITRAKLNFRLPHLMREPW